MSPVPDNSDEQFERAPKNEASAINSKAVWAAVGIGVVISLGTVAIMNPPLAPAVAPSEQTTAPNEKRGTSDEEKADEEAKQTLDTMASAQAAYVGLSADRGRVTFGSMEDMQKEKLLDPASDRVAADQSSVAISGEGNTAHYGASSISTSGKVFYIGERKTQPVEVIRFDPADTTTELKLKSAAEAGLSGDLDGDFTN